MFRKISKYISEVGQEISKVSWPGREELYGSTAVVIVVCLIMAVFVFSIDKILSFLLVMLFPKG